MSCEHSAGLLYPECIPAPETVTRHPKFLDTQLLFEVLHSRSDPPIHNLLIVCGEKLFHGPSWLVEVCWGGRAGEEVRGYGNVTCAGEGVGEAGGVSW